jgi:hypothetical protein
MPCEEEMFRSFTRIATTAPWVRRSQNGFESYANECGLVEKYIGDQKGF